MNHRDSIAGVLDLYGAHYEWARGVMYADHSIRFDNDPLSHRKFAAACTSVDFLRGVFDGGAKIYILCAPVIKLEGTPKYLAAVVEFLYDQFPNFDKRATLAKLAAKGRLWTQGNTAQDLFACLWPTDKVITLPSHRDVGTYVRDYWKSSLSRDLRSERLTNCVGKSLISKHLDNVTPRAEYRGILDSIYGS